MPQHKKQHKIIIVGAGLAGLGCAKKLHENGEKFLLLSPDIGGRVKSSVDGEVNYGAYYITEDCKTIWPYIETVKQMRFKHYHYHDGKKHYHFNAGVILSHAPELFRLWRHVLRFRKHFLKMREASFEHSRKELIDADPVLSEYYHQTAREFIKKQGLERFQQKYLDPPLWASFFSDPRDMPTFVYLQCLMPMLVKTYAFKMHFKKIMQGFQTSYMNETVTEVKGDGESYTLKTKNGHVYECDRLILATPMTITNRLLKDTQSSKKAIEVKYLHVKGKPRKKYDQYGYHFFPLKDVTALSQEEDGTYLYFYQGKNNIEKYFSSYDVIYEGEWKPALLLQGDQFVDIHPKKHLFLANDHNVASTEDAFINGQYVAKMVLESLD